MDDLLPRPGDVVICRQVHSPAVYVLGRFDAAEQLYCKDYDEAVARASRFARREHLDAWYTNDGQHYERVARHRPSARPSRRLTS